MFRFGVWEIIAIIAVILLIFGHRLIPWGFRQALELFKGARAFKESVQSESKLDEDGNKRQPPPES